MMIFFVHAASVEKDTNDIHRQVNENISVTPTNANFISNPNIQSMKSTTSTLSPNLARRRRGRPPKIHGMTINNVMSYISFYSLL